MGGLSISTTRWCWGSRPSLPSSLWRGTLSLTSFTACLILASGTARHDRADANRCAATSGVGFRGRRGSRSAELLERVLGAPPRESCRDDRPRFHPAHVPARSLRRPALLGCHALELPRAGSGRGFCPAQLTPLARLRRTRPGHVDPPALRRPHLSVGRLPHRSPRADRRSVGGAGGRLLRGG